MYSFIISIFSTCRASHSLTLDNRMIYSCFAEQNMNCCGVPLTLGTQIAIQIYNSYPRFAPAVNFIFFMQNNCISVDEHNLNCGKPHSQIIKSYHSRQKKKASSLTFFLIIFLNYSVKIHEDLFLCDYMNPSLWSFDMSHLDACKCIAELLCNSSHLFHSAWEADFLAMVNNLAYR